MILPLEQQLSSLEPSKRLKELGVKQESLFYWGQRKSPITTKLYNPDLFYGNQEGGLTVIASAFTVAELGEMLPEEYWTSKDCTSRYVANMQFPIFIEEETEADARAKMLIYLLEQGLCQV